MSEAEAWRDWLLRAIAGSPDDLQIMYGVAGERRLTGARAAVARRLRGLRPGPGRATARSDQLQLDVLRRDRRRAVLARGGRASRPPTTLGRSHGRSFDWLESGWRQPDEGIWEVRGPRRHFTHSKVMAWVAFDRAVKTVERFGRDGPVERWQAAPRGDQGRGARVQGYNAERGTFVQFYGSDRLDASLPPDPARRLPARRRPARRRDRARDRAGAPPRRLRRALPRGRGERRAWTGSRPGEGVFLPCSFWLAAVLAQQGRRDEAVELYERLLSLAERPRPALGGVRPGARAPRRELPAGVHAPRHRRDRVHALAAADDLGATAKRRHSPGTPFSDGGAAILELEAGARRRGP